MNSTRHSTLSRNRDDELVEEIASLIKIVAIHRNHEVTQASEGAAMAIIERIGKAYVDGMPLPGEVGRTEIQVSTRITSGLLASFQTWVREAITQKEAKILIALSPTGEEE